MFSGVASSKVRVVIFPFVALLAIGWVAREVERHRLAGAIGHRPPVSGWGMFSGMRAATAGGLWLRTNLAWERKDASATSAWLRLAVAADGQTTYFRINGARMLAYDFPAWRIDAAMPGAVQNRIRRESAESALEFLMADSNFADAADLLIEGAVIRLRVLGDREGAADFFRRAALCRDAPAYAARIHADLLCDLGREEEALQWLRDILPGLSPDDVAARRSIVIERIMALEAAVAGR